MVFSREEAVRPGLRSRANGGSRPPRHPTSIGRRGEERGLATWYQSLRLLPAKAVQLEILEFDMRGRQQARDNMGTASTGGLRGNLASHGQMSICPSHSYPVALDAWDCHQGNGILNHCIPWGNVCASETGVLVPGDPPDASTGRRPWTPLASCSVNSRASP